MATRSLELQGAIRSRYNSVTALSCYHDSICPAPRFSLLEMDSCPDLPCLETRVLSPPLFTTAAICSAKAPDQAVADASGSASSPPNNNSDQDRPVAELAV